MSILGGTWSLPESNGSGSIRFEINSLTTNAPGTNRQTYTTIAFIHRQDERDLEEFNGKHCRCIITDDEDPGNDHFTDAQPRSP